MNNLFLLDWLTRSNLPFSIVDNPQWRLQQLYNNLLLRDEDLPHSKTIIRLLVAEYHRAVQPIKDLLQTARGMIHITFDGWTSRQFTSFVGVHAHFIDVNFRRWVVLLGLPALLGRHKGDDVATEVLAILRFFEIENRVGYFTLDNESKNSTTMAKIGEQLGFDGEERQIRCAPHGLQLAVRALLYGENCKRLPLDEVLRSWSIQDFATEEEEDLVLDQAFEGLREELQDDPSQQESDHEDAQQEDENLADYLGAGESDDGQDEDDDLLQALDYLAPEEINTRTMAKWQKQGPLGKLHNHGNCFHRSSQLVAALEASQRAINSEGIAKTWIHNNATRWQSDEAMAARALELRRPLERLHNDLHDQWEAAGAKENDKPLILDFRLGPQDWRVVGAIQKILVPFKAASIQLQGDGAKGALDQCFPLMEYLLLHLEDCARGEIYQERVDPEHPAGPRLQEIVKIFQNLEPRRRRFLKAHIKVGLWKLQLFYDKLTNLSYAAAVVFNPALKFSGLQGIFDAEPQRQQDGWRDCYNSKLRNDWENNYKTK